MKRAPPQQSRRSEPGRPPIAKNTGPARMLRGAGCVPVREGGIYTSPAWRFCDFSLLKPSG